MAGNRLISERDVLRAARDGAKTIEVGGAAVTPSARDAAKRSGVELVGGAGGRAKPSAAAPRTKPSPTAPGSAAPAPPPAPTAASPSPPAAPRPTLSVALGADHGGVALKDAVAARLRELGHTVTDLGTTGSAAVDYPDYAIAVASTVAGGRADFGVMVDGAGIGSCMAANKVRGARAAMCYDVTTATNAREHNNANVLTLGGGLIGARLAMEIVETFLRTPFAGGRHATRVAKIDALDAARRGATP